MWDWSVGNKGKRLRSVKTGEWHFSNTIKKSGFFNHIEFKKQNKNEMCPY